MLKHGFFKLQKTVVLVGMMGVGKTSIGRLLSKRLVVPFKDSDLEVESAANCSVANIYEWYGEQAFKDAERRVVKRLVEEPPHIMSTGVEAFITPECRELIKKHCISVWLAARIETIYPRVARRSHRPQLEKGDKKAILQDLIDKYYPIYAEADIRVDCDNQSPEHTVDEILSILEEQYQSD